MTHNKEDRVPFKGPKANKLKAQSPKPKRLKKLLSTTRDSTVAVGPGSQWRLGRDLGAQGPFRTSVHEL